MTDKCKMTDEQLLLFVRFCVLNPSMTEDAALMRRVFNAYAKTPMPKAA